MRVTILSTLQHIYGIYVPTFLHAQELEKEKEYEDLLLKELKKEQEDPSYIRRHVPPYIRKHAAAHEPVVIQPGINTFDEKTLDRLKKSRAFNGLIEKGDFKINDNPANESYQLKINPNLKNTKEFQEAKDRMNLELKNKAQEQEIANLKNDLNGMKDQIAEMLKLMKSKRSANDKHKTSEPEVINDNPSDDKGPVS